MLQKNGEILTRWAQKNMPDPFIFALALSGLTLVLGLTLTSVDLAGMLSHWHFGFWVFLKFGMQMCLILVTGYALATSGPIHYLIAGVARYPKDTAGAAMMICFVSVVMGYINWGLAIVVGALLAREVAREAWFNGVKMHYPLLGAAGYMGVAVWHGGLSGSAPLKLAEKGHELSDLAGVISVSDTLFSPMNLLVSVCLNAILFKHSNNAEIKKGTVNKKQQPNKLLTIFIMFSVRKCHLTIKRLCSLLSK